MRKPKLSELPVEELIRQAKEGDSDALEELLTRFQDVIQAHAKQHGKPYGPGGTRPSDISQLASLRVLQKFSTFQGQTEGELRTWLKRVVISQAVQVARHATSQKRDESGAVPFDSDEAQEAPALQRSPSQAVSQQQEALRLIRSIYSELSGSQSDAVKSYYLNGLSLRDIALRMGKSEDAVASLMQRGVGTLKQRLQDECAAGNGDEDVVKQSRLDSAFLAYLRRLAAETDVDPVAFAAGYPDCAPELEGLLLWAGRLQALRPPVPFETDED
ncbi:sigma-70 family RNA polymerase sigma factor [Myxococcus sp. Y35]|uniref:sigma-70 family RNA polymerase sigma factor n=1 Tax=Pseudomyxococcus flavus TaxID=3115648 RepID=UPI003CE831B9